MNKFTIAAAAMAAFLLVGFKSTHEVCETYGRTTTCRREFKPTEAQRERRLENAIFTLDVMNCVDRGRGTEDFCEDLVRAQNRSRAAETND